VGAEEMTIEWKIDVGSMLTLLTVVIGLVSVFLQLGKIQLKIDLLWNWFQQEKLGVDKG
jgi:hypothetical protein